MTRKMVGASPASASRRRSTSAAISPMTAASSRQATSRIGWGSTFGEASERAGEGESAGLPSRR